MENNMPKNYSRKDRISDNIHRIIATLIQTEFKDPRAGMITLSEVDVSPDLKYAKIYTSVMPDEKRAETLKILNNASGFFRTHLSKHLKLRVVPRIQFVFDETAERAFKMTTLLDKLGKENDH